MVTGVRILLLLAVSDETLAGFFIYREAPPLPR
jgi:hypothetical protein